MDFQTLIATRHSLRSYDPGRPVSREVLTRILNAGRLAPSAANKQPWQFVVIASAEKLAQLSACYARDWFKEAPQVLAVVGNRDQAWQRSDKYCAIETDLTIAMDHMILAAAAEGVGTCWIANFDYKIVREVLGLSDPECVFAITPLGYPPAGYVQPEKKPRKPLEELVRFI